VFVRFTSRLAVAIAIGSFLSFTIAVGYTQVVLPLSEVKGTVFDETGAVIPNCEIVFRSDSESIGSHTGMDGSVTVRLRSGRYAVTTSHVGFVKSEILDVQIVTPMPDTLRIVLKVDHTPTDGGIVPMVELLPASSELPSALGPEPSIAPTARPGRKSRSWRCLYLWKCSTS